jgi:hypothetical protein
MKFEPSLFLSRGNENDAELEDMLHERQNSKNRSFFTNPNQSYLQLLLRSAPLSSAPRQEEQGGAVVMPEALLKHLTRHEEQNLLQAFNDRKIKNLE